MAAQSGVLYEADRSRALIGIGRSAMRVLGYQVLASNENNHEKMMKESFRKALERTSLHK